MEKISVGFVYALTYLPIYFVSLAVTNFLTVTSSVLIIASSIFFSVLLEFFSQNIDSDIKSRLKVYGFVMAAYLLIQIILILINIKNILPNMIVVASIIIYFGAGLGVNFALIKLKERLRNGKQV